MGCARSKWSIGTELSGHVTSKHCDPQQRVVKRKNNN